MPTYEETGLGVVAEDLLDWARVVGEQFAPAGVIPAKPPSVLAALLAQGTVQIVVSRVQFALELPPHLVVAFR